jgi:hypothetical protein
MMTLTSAYISFPNKKAGPANHPPYRFDAPQVASWLLKEISAPLLRLAPSPTQAYRVEAEASEKGIG